MGYKNPRSN